MPEPTLVNLTIDGVAVQAPKGEKIIEAAKRVGIEIPYFCYHKRLSVESGANCRMCLVEVSMPRRGPDGVISVVRDRKPHTACSLGVDEGMVVETETEQIVKDRRGVLEFLLINHPLDCPICDRGGECPLQNNVLHYGPPTSRFVEEKRHFPKAYPLSDHVVFDRERCIHCARCTRFTTDISGDAQLDFLFRGADTRVATFNETVFSSRFSGNVIELCPVGALLSRDYRFKARPWDLMTQKSICTECSNGCNTKLDHRAGRLQRVNARENDLVNEEWTCDRGKFGMGYVSRDDRLTRPLVRKDGRFVEATWDEALGQVAERLREAGEASGVIAGARSSNEDLYVLQRLFRETLGSSNLDHRTGPDFGAVAGTLFRKVGYHAMGNSLAELDTMKAVLVVGELVDEQPMVFLRVRKAWRLSGAAIVEVGAGAVEDAPSHVKDIAAAGFRVASGSEVTLVRGLLAAMLDAGSIAPERADAARAATHGVTVAQAAAECVVDAADISVAARALATDRTAIVAGDVVRSHSDPSALVAALADLAIATGNAGNVNIPVLGANGQGAMDLGIVPEMLPGYVPAERPGMNTQRMLEGARSGALGALLVLGVDLATAFHDRALATAALESCPFVAVCDYALTDTARMADVVLPLATVAETDGTFTNCERRVQRFLKAFEFAPGLEPGWSIAARIAGRIGEPMPYFSARDVLRDIAANVPIYSACDPRTIGDTGVRWEYPK